MNMRSKIIRHCADHLPVYVSILFATIYGTVYYPDMYPLLTNVLDITNTTNFVLVRIINMSRNVLVILSRITIVVLEFLIVIVGGLICGSIGRHYLFMKCTCAYD